MAISVFTLGSEVSLDENFVEPSWKGLRGAICSMEHIEEALGKLKDWARKLIELLLGPEMEPEPEPIPVPVEERSFRQRR